MGTTSNASRGPQLPNVALVGRPNVGKSTLFNRLIGKNKALVDSTPGLTRDRKEGDATLNGRSFIVTDTAGFEHKQEGSLQEKMWEQAETAVKKADVTLFILDGKEGLTPQDQQIAQNLRKLNVPIILVVNKCDTPQAEATIMDAYTLGFGTPVEIASTHGWGMAELSIALEEHLPKHIAQETSDNENDPNEKALKFAIVGRPNVGKSSLVNAIIKEERLLVGEEAGVTRDSIALSWQYKDTLFELIDTAGLRKKAKVNEKLEYLSTKQTRESIQFAPIVLVLLDVTRALEKQDLSIVQEIYEEGRCIIIGLNKWDLVKGPQRAEYLKVFEERLNIFLPQVEGIPFVPLSAKSGQGLSKVFDTALQLYDVWEKKISTSKLNSWLEACLNQHQPPLIKGRRLKIRYITQKKSRPPTFFLFTNIVQEFPESYLRYLQRRMRQAFDMPGVPLRFVLKKGDNPYHQPDKK